jgi:hypothetical protein
MELESLSDTVKKALDYYDNQQMKYRHLINNQNSYYNIPDNSIIFNDINEEYYSELLGYYDNLNGIWIWGWVLADFNYKDTPVCKDLLDYGLKLEPSSSTREQIMIKGILVNSRIKIDEQVQLEINISIYAYLIRERIKLIYAKKKYLDEAHTNYVTFYYLLK